MNFGEAIAYWYLRLNGFFPLVNFVLHRHEHFSHNADADLLAVRFPFVAEPIGGQDEDWDHSRFNDWGLAHRENIVCIICEVKTGRVTSSAIRRSFSVERLRIALQRFGVHPPETLNTIAGQLGDDAVTTQGHITYAKLLIAGDDSNLGAVPCCRISLQESVDFIRGRMAKYRNSKQASRMFFPGDLVQYLAWETECFPNCNRPA